MVCRREQQGKLLRLRLDSLGTTQIGFFRSGLAPSNPAQHENNLCSDWADFLTEEYSLSYIMTFVAILLDQ